MKNINENIFFIPKIKVLSERNITYANPLCDYRPLKDDPYRIRITIGGNKLPYPSYSGSPAATLLEAEIIFNSVISTPGSQFIYANTKDYFICLPMERFE